MAGTSASASASAVAPVVCYCVASILMTVVNKFVVSGANFSMTFLLLTIQSSVCIACVLLAKKLGVISFRQFDLQDVKAWWPISFMLAGVIYTGSKSLQYLSIPVYTIFKNLTIILIAYGEVLWFGGKVTTLTLVSFIFMVLSSVIAAWADVANALSFPGYSESEGYGEIGMGIGGLEGMKNAVYKLNIGYLWMFINCLTSAAYVLTMRKRIKSLNFSDWDSMFYSNLISIPFLFLFSILFEDWGTANLEASFPQETRVRLLSAIAFSGAAAVGISFTTAWCVRVTSSTTYSMVGALNKLPVAASGMIFFSDPVTLGSVSAITVGFGAGLLYAVAKNNQKKVESAQGGQGSVIPLTNTRKSSERNRT